MHVTPEAIEASYRLLCTTLPFRRWKMPHPDKLAFRVMTTRERLGHFVAYVGYDEIGEIAVSTKVKTLHLLNEVVAHEMVHEYQERLGHKDGHGRHFKRLAGVVCRRHGWDLVKF